MRRVPSLWFARLAALACIFKDSSACPSPCTCWWKSGKEMVRCSGVSSMPTGLASTTQVLDLTGNVLRFLPEEFFLRNNLLHLQRIYLAHCRLIAIHATAFVRLANLVDLDLSDNELASVPTETFAHFPGLRRLSLSGNPLGHLNAKAFAQLTDLTILELSHCHLESVNDSAFLGLSSLTQLKLDGNLLQTLNGEVVAPLISLHALLLHDNPWFCDCRLRALHRWLVARHLHQSAPPSICANPSHVHNQALDELNEQTLACPPRGPYIHRRVKALRGDDAVLLCKITSDPEARIQWQWQGRPITNLSLASHSSQPYLIQESGTVNKTSALRVASVSNKNAGQYVCFAQNLAGSFTQTLSLHVVERAGAEAEVHVGQVVGIFLAVMATTMSIVILCLLLFKRRPIRSKYLKYFSVSTLRQSFPFQRNRRFEQGDIPELQALKKTSHNGKRPLSPDAMSFLVNDFGVPQSPYHLSCVQSNRPDVIHVQEPMRQGSERHENSCEIECCSQNNESTIENNSCNPVHNGHTTESDVMMPVCTVDTSFKDERYSEEEKESKRSIDADLIDKLKWSESFSSSHDLAEEIEMKVHLDHLSAESKWKQSNISLSKFTTSTNNEWFADEHDTYHHSPKHYPETSWWESHELPIDNSYSICMYEKPATQVEEDQGGGSANNNNHGASKQLQAISPSASIPETSVSPNLFLPSFTDFLYDSPETDL